MEKVLESIWSNEDFLIPMSEVSHIEKLKYDDVMVIFKHSKWDGEAQQYSPNVFLVKEKAQKFIQDFCYYRYEIEGSENGFKMPV